MNVTPLDAADANAAVGLSQQAGWGMRSTDWEVRTAEATVAVGGFIDNELISTTTVAQYGDIGWCSR